MIELSYNFYIVVYNITIDKIDFRYVFHIYVTHYYTMPYSGRLDLFIGPMFSGKTTEIVKKYNECIQNNINVVAINYAEDTRYHTTMLSSHDKVMIPCIQCMQLNEIATTDEVMNSDVVLINEGQFFPDVYEVVVSLVETYNKHVIICGLDGDFKRNKFGRLCDLIPYCDSITKLTAICECGKPSIFSHRTSVETAQVVIGSNNYKPLCRKCYINANSTHTISAEISQ